LLLGASRKRPRGRRAAHKRDELAPSHRLTLKPRVDILSHSVNLSVVHHSKIGRRLAAMGHLSQTETLPTLAACPLRPLKRTISRRLRYVRFVPFAS
jgi:hypothetical protein